MFGNKKPKKKWRRLAVIVLSSLSLAALAYAAITLITGRNTDLSRVADLFSPRVPVDAVQEYYFDVGSDRVFADLGGGSLAAAGTLGIQVLDTGGSEPLRDFFRMSAPAISAANGRAIAYDIGGTAFYVFDKKRILAAFEASGVIVSASINKNGWFCVNTQEGGGLRGVTTVYNSKAAPVFRVNLASGYALSSALSPDNKVLAVLNITDVGSRITIYNGLNKTEPDSTFELTGELILDTRFLSGGDLLAISMNSLIAIDKNGASRILYEYFDKRLGGYSLDENALVLHLLDFGIGYGGRLLSLDKDWKIIAEIATDREIISMSLKGKHLAVLRNDGLIFYNAAFEAFSPKDGYTPVAGVNRVITLSNGSALVTSDNSAVVINR